MGLKELMIRGVMHKLNVIAASSELKKIAIKVLILYLVSKYLLCKFIVVTVEKQIYSASIGGGLNKVQSKECQKLFRVVLDEEMGQKCDRDIKTQPEASASLTAIHRTPQFLASLSHRH